MNPTTAAQRVAATAARIAAAGRAAWPGVSLGEAALVARLQADPDAIAGELGEPDVLHDGDVYLATALAAGDAAALRAFEDALVPHMTMALRRLRLGAGTADEVVRALRVELLVQGKIADYAGRGALAGWLRVTATRAALELVRRDAPEKPLDEVLLEHWPSSTPEPATRHLRARFTAELKTAIAGGFAALEVRQRNLLRQHLFDELTIDDLANLYRVPRGTCARWLADARVDLGHGTRERLGAALGAPAEQVESLLRFLDRDLEVSISRLLVAR